MVDVRLKSGKPVRTKQSSHKTAKILVFLILAVTVGFMALLGKDMLNIGGENKETLTSELIFSGEVTRAQLGLSKNELKQLGRIQRAHGNLFKHVVINTELYTYQTMPASKPDAPLIFWLEIKTRNGKVLKPMRIKSSRRDFVKRLAKAVDAERAALAVAAKREAETKKKIKAVHGN